MALRILLADDSMTAQNMGKKILTDAGYEVVTVSNGAAAVKKIAEVTPDLAILDVYMPGYNGLEVCERVKLSPATTRTPVLLSVGKMEPFRPEDGMKVKADGVIIKPFEATDLVTVVQKLVARAVPAVTAAAPAPVAPEPPAEDAPALDAATHLDEVPVTPPALELQTFGPADDPIAVPDEPHLEMTSASNIGAVDAVAPPDFEATSLQAAAEPAVRHVMTEAALMDGYSFAAPAPEDAPSIEDVLSDEDREFLSMTARADAVPEFAATPQSAEREAAAVGVPEVAPAEAEAVASPQSEPMSEQPVLEEHTSAAPVWHAEEEELTDDDLALDLEEVMRKPEPQPAPALADAALTDEVLYGGPQPEQAHTGVAAFTALTQDSGETAASGTLDHFDPFVDLTPPVAPARSTAAPMLAPIGKTSFDELDAVMEQAASQFGSASSSAAMIQQAQPTSAGSSDVFADLVPETHAANDDLLADPLDMAPLPAAESDAFPDLIVEEPSAAPESAPSVLHGSNGLSGIFELDPPAQAEPQSEVTSDAVSQPGDISAHAQHAADSPAASDDFLQQLDEVEDSVSVAAPVEPAQDALDEFAELSPADPASQAEEACLAVTLPAQAHCETESESLSPEVATTSAREADISSPVEEMAEPAVMEQAAELAVAAVNAEMQSAPHPPAEGDGPVDRVVSRVVDRLRPMLTIMVEEIMKELKKNV